MSGYDPGYGGAPGYGEGQRKRAAFLAAEHFEGRQARDQDRRLADGRRVQFLGRSLPAEGRQIVAQDVVRPPKQFAGRWVRVAPVADHADGLGPLAGKEQRRLAVACLPVTCQGSVPSLDDCAAHVVAAGAANTVRGHSLAAV